MTFKLAFFRLHWMFCDDVMKEVGPWYPQVFWSSRSWLTVYHSGYPQQKAWTGGILQVCEVCGVYSRYDSMVHTSLWTDLVQWWISIKQGQVVAALSRGNNGGQEWLPICACLWHLNLPYRSHNLLQFTDLKIQGEKQWNSYSMLWNSTATKPM